MQKIRITKEFDFEMAHVLSNYDGPCKNIHGHSYKLFITISGKPLNNAGHPKQGMLMDFGELKKMVREEIIDKYDHSLVINANSPQQLINTVEQMFEKFEIVEFQPTCENLVIDFANRIKHKLPGSVKLFSVKLVETATSFAEWYASDNE